MHILAYYCLQGNYFANFLTYFSIKSEPIIHRRYLIVFMRKNIEFFGAKEEEMPTERAFIQNKINKDVLST